MDYIDNKYLGMQFRLKVHEKSATEFQSFFESIMQKAFPEFRKVEPYGNRGDGGNDGYLPKEGIYYQIYSPINPSEKQSTAAKKLKKDFENLKKNWTHISDIKTFNFVFNDKGRGVSIEIEEALAELRTANPGIKFELFLPNELERIFFSLEKDTIALLGFDVDSRDALKICMQIVEALEVSLDRGNGKYVCESIQKYEDIINSQNDDNLLADWEMLECRALQLLERIPEAKEKYQNLCKRYPKDPRPFLYLAEIYLNEEDYDKNEDLLKEAEGIDSKHWLLTLEKIHRNQRLDRKIDVSRIDENDFPADFRIKSNHYRFYTVALYLGNNFTKAQSFIEKAIHLNPDRLANYITKLGLLEYQIFSQSKDVDEMRKDSEKLLLEVDSVLGIVGHWGELSPRNQAILSLEKLKAFQVLENDLESQKCAKESFDAIIRCYFDVSVDHCLVGLLFSVELPKDDFEKLLVYLKTAQKGISHDLAKALIFQFNLKGTLFLEGKRFFEAKDKTDILNFIDSLEKRNYEEVWSFMKDDWRFALAFAQSAKDFPEFRRKIIEDLPDNGNIPKSKLLLLINYEESNIDEAFDILKAIDLSKLHFSESKIILEVAKKKKAWDFEIVIIEKLLGYEKDKSIALQLKLESFNANLSLKRFPETIEIGEKILANSEELALLDDRNKESLLAQTVMARLTRGDYPEALALVEAHSGIPKTIEFKAGVEADVYLKNEDALKAIASIVDGMKILKSPTPEQYAKLFMVLVEIDHLIEFSLTSLPKFEEESFVKFKDQERWYFIGAGDELDAIKVPPTDPRYNVFLGKNVGDKIVFDFKYKPKSEYILESILPIEKYIFAQAVRHFNHLAASGNLKAVQMIAVPQKGDTIDPENIVAFLKDDRKGRMEFFNSYCKDAIPLAFLAITEGGLTNAIAVIQNENRGFVRFSTGDLAEINKQKEVAKRIIAGDPFYLDGTSALILSETGLLPEIYPLLPNLKVPQSVIDMLLKCEERFRYVPGQAGYLQYVQGKLRISSINQEEARTLTKKFEDSIEVLESKAENIGMISPARKSDCLSEQRVPADLCDACILAQKDDVPVLTEDYLYLQANELETKKKAPKYSSSFALMRVLYEQKKITFERYVGFFAYLSRYRFRFLPLTSDDIEKAVFGDGIIAMIRPERIKWFNFPLTLSEEYGVAFATSFSVIMKFLLKVLTDDTILPDVAERIFLEILSEFPENKDKQMLGKLFINICSREIEKMQNTITLGKATKNKIDRLSQLAQIFTGGDSLWTP